MKTKAILFITIASLAVSFVFHKDVRAQKYSEAYSECSVCLEDNHDPVERDFFLPDNVSQECMNCIKNVAIKIDDPSGCERIDGYWTYVGDDCYIAFAIKRMSRFYCEEIKGKEETDTLERQNVCYRKLTAALRETDVCANYIKHADIKQCYYDVAMASNQPELCDKTDEPDLCYWHVATYNDNPSACDFAGQNKTRCYSELPISLKTGMGQKIIIQLVFTGILIIISGAVLLRRKTLPRVIVGMVLGVLAATILYVSGYLFWQTGYAFFSRFLLLGIPVAIFWILDMSSSSQEFIWETIIDHFDILGQFESWFCFIASIFFGGLLGALAGSRVNKIIKIILFILYALVVGGVLFFTIEFFSSFS